jgi:tol-pal system protein YbgF
MLLTLSMFTGCATIGEVGAMRTDMDEDRRKVNKIDDRVQELEEQILQLQAVKTGTTKGQSKVLQNIQQVEAEIQRLNNRLDEIEYAIGANQAHGIGQERKSLNQRVNELEEKIRSLGAQRPSAPQVPIEPQRASDESKPAEPAQPEQPTESTQSAPIPTKNDETLYKEAHDAYTRGDTAGARTNFEMIIKEFPKSKYVDNASYWIGECYYKEGDFENAILAFEEMLSKFPNSNKAPSAMLKQGYAFYKRGDKDNGKYILEKLIKKYPNSEEAKKASSELTKQ